MSGLLTVVVGGQFGSEGKGGVAAHIARRTKVDYAIRVAGPNAGHTAYDDDGRKIVCRQVPVVAVIDDECRVAIAAGSEIDPEVLLFEQAMLLDYGHSVEGRLDIDPQVTLITDDNREAEVRNLTARVGSTAKGIGAARASRIWRQAPIWKDAELGGDFQPYDVVDVAERARQVLGDGGHVLIEGTQGFGLGLHAGYYPFCTSSDCRAIDMLAMAGLSPWAPEVGELDVWVVCRTYPIRVAGNSGPLVGELSWDELGRRTQGHIEVERTTVTNKVRRVGEWDTELVRAAMTANGSGRHTGRTHVYMALTFFDYWYPDCYEATRPTQLSTEQVRQVQSIVLDTGASVGLITTGPNSGMWA